MLAVSRALANGQLNSMDGIMALRQTAGRGRLKRSWHTGEGHNLAVSFWVEMGAELLPPLPLAAALAVIDSLSCMGLSGQLGCKWPNDIKAQGKKICGILCQYAEGASPKQTGCIVGIGINLDLSAEETAAIDQPAVSVKALTGQTVPPEDMCRSLQEALAKRVGRLQAEGFGSMAEEWYGMCEHAGAMVSIDTGFSAIAGRTCGVGELGELILDCGGTKRSIICGDVQRLFTEGDRQAQ